MPFGLSTMAVKAIGVALLVLAILGAIAGFAAHERGVQKAEDAAAAQQITAQREAIAASAAATNQAESARRAAVIQGAASAAELQASAARADAVAARSALGRMLQRAAAARGGACRGDPAIAGSSSPASGAAGMQPDLLASMGELAGRYAADADASRIAGQACERAYQSLTATTP